MDRRVSGLEKQIKGLKQDNNSLSTRLARVEGNFSRKFSNEMRKLATDYLIQNPDLPEEDPIVLVDGKKDVDVSPSTELAKYGVAIKEQRKLKKKSYYYDFDFNNDFASPGDLPTGDVLTKTVPGTPGAAGAQKKLKKTKTTSCAKCIIM